MESLFERLLVWEDPVARSGPENMALDEVLLNGLGADPVLRIYRWGGEWVSFGYFQKLAEARNLFGGKHLEFVRRLTGGGVVDHRNDVTYSLLVPRGEALAEVRGVGSYRAIHAVVVEALGRAGLSARMLTADDASESAACFQKGVAWDVVGEDGGKLAGAGQRRNRAGLLHQGSVLGGESVRTELVKSFGVERVAWEPGEGVVEAAGKLAEQKYATQAWLEKR